LVVYLGASTEADDSSFRSFEAAMHRWTRPASKPYVLRYHRVSIAEEPERGERELALAKALRPAILLAPTGNTALASVRRRGEAQIVFASHPHPVRHGIVPSLKLPGSGITGISLVDDLHAKRLELLRDAYPGIRTVGVLADRSWWNDFGGDDALRAEAATLGLRLHVLLADTEVELAGAMGSSAVQAADAWYVPATYLSYVAEAAILHHLQRLGRPSMHTTLGEVERGAPLAYVQDTSFVFDAMADLTHRVLRGVDAGSIPVQGPRQFVLAVRPRETPAALRLHPSIVRRADRVY
jgi:ABC-type uncharacterized transport system substrate-binding protein